MTDVVAIGLYLTYILIGVAVLAVIILPMINALNNPKSLIISGIGLGVLLVIFLISFGLSGDQVSAKAAEEGLDSSGVKMVGGAITMMYILLAFAIVGIVVTEVSKAFK